MASSCKDSPAAPPAPSCLALLSKQLQGSVCSLARAGLAWAGHRWGRTRSNMPGGACSHGHSPALPGAKLPHVPAAPLSLCPGPCLRPQRSDSSPGSKQGSL